MLKTSRNKGCYNMIRCMVRLTYARLYQAKCHPELHHMDYDIIIVQQRKMSWKTLYSIQKSGYYES